MQNAAKVGLLVVVFVGLLVGAYAVLGRSLFAPPVKTYFADFGDVAGITPGTRVLMAGVRIGSVSGVQLVSPRQARLTLTIEEAVRIPVGSQAVIPSSLIGLGDNPVTIEPPARPAGTLPSGSILVGRRGNALDNILPNSEATVAELTKTLTAVRKLLEDERLRGRVDSLLASTDKTITQFGKLAEDVDRTLVRNQANIDRALAAGTNAVQDVRRVTYRVAQLAEDRRVEGDLRQIVGNVKDITQETERLVTSLDRLVNDPNLRQPANQIAGNVAEITETGKTIAKNAEEITRNFATVSEKAITLTDRANQLALGAIEIEEQVRGTLDRVTGFFTRRPSTGGFDRLGAQLDLLRESEPGYWRTDLTLTYPLSDGNLYAGLFDAFESNRITLQLGKPVRPDLQVRYGLFASKAAVGVDYRLSPRLSIRGDAWDINSPRLDLRARYDFGNGLIGWFGVDRAFRDNAPIIGIGIRR